MKHQFRHCQPTMRICFHSPRRNHFFTGVNSASNKVCSAPVFKDRQHAPWALTDVLNVGIRRSCHRALQGFQGIHSWASRSLPLVYRTRSRWSNFCCSLFRTESLGCNVSTKQLVDVCVCIAQARYLALRSETSAYSNSYG